MTANNSQSQGKRKPGGRGVELVLWPTTLFFVGLFAMFIAERAIGKESLQKAFDGLSMLLLLGSLVGFAARRSSAQDPADKQAQSKLLLAGLCSTIGVGLYLLFSSKSPGVTGMLHSTFEKNLEKVSSMVQVLWPAMLLLGAIPVAFITQALFSMTDGQGRAEAIEPQRIRYSTQSGLSLALVVVFVGAINYVATERNVKLEYARFRTTRPSEVTRKVAQNLSRTIRATLFYPTGNEVREQVQPYFDDLAAQGDKFKVEVLDHALEPNRARELSATGNGIVVLSVIDDKGVSTQRETLNLGSTIETAQSNLNTLDT